MDGERGGDDIVEPDGREENDTENKSNVHVSNEGVSYNDGEYYWGNDDEE